MTTKDFFGSGLKAVAGDIKEYIESRFQLTVLRGGERLSVILSETLQNMVVFSVIGIGVALLLISLSFYLGEITGSTALGFLITGGAAALTGTLMFTLKSKILSKRIHGRIMRELLEVVDEMNNEPQNTELEPEKALTDGR